MKLNVRAFAVVCALIWGVGVFLATWWIILFEGPTEDPTFIGRVYRGFSVTAAGSLVGLVWGLADGLIVGALFAWLYNRLGERFSAVAE